MDSKTIQLGEQLFPVVPQKHARLRHRLKGQDFQKLLTGAFKGEYSEDAYKIICILIPSVDPNTKQNRATGGGMPFWQFDGFPTEELWKAYQSGDEDAYDEDNDPSPTTKQIVDAIMSALQVSGGDTLGKIVGLAETSARLQLRQETPALPEQPGNTGGSPSTNTGTNPPTSTPSGASLHVGSDYSST